MRYRSAAMAEFMRALRTLKELQAEQAANAMEGVARRPAARVSRRVEPHEPRRGATPRLDYVMPDLPIPVPALHEPAAPWLPNQHETGPRRVADDIGARLPNEPEAAGERNDMKRWASACHASATTPSRRRAKLETSHRCGQTKGS
jgi:hypothetical protein